MVNAAAGPPKLRILYLAGIGRSGSTLLDRMLGQVPGHTSLGEVSWHLFERCLRKPQWSCGCGKPFRECEYWTQIGDKAFGGWNALDLDEVVRLQRSVDKTESIPLLLAPRLVPSFKRNLERYLDYLVPVYAAAQELSGADVIVDSSKNPSVPYVLRHAPVDIRVVHIVRDPRGVAYSWSKPNQKRGPDGTGDFMPTWAPRRTARRWVTVNAMIAALPRFGVPVVQLRYEDLMRDPLPQLAKVGPLVGRDLSDGALAHVRPEEVELRPAHTAAGNPNRFNTGWVPLRTDEVWRDKLPSRSRRVVETITWPSRRRYRYT